MSNHIQSSIINVIAVSKLNGHPVSIFQPPHQEPDLPWVNVGELLTAICPDHLLGFYRRNVTAIFKRLGCRAFPISDKENEVVIVSHLMAQALCATIDEMATGCPDPYGPREEGYVTWAYEAFSKHHPMTLDQAILAFANLGGPFARPLN